MLSRRADQKDALVHSLASQGSRAGGKSRGGAAKQFISQFYAHVAPEDMLSVPEQDLLGAAMSAWKFFADRAARKPSIRVFNPSRKNTGGKPITPLSRSSTTTCRSWWTR